MTVAVASGGGPGRACPVCRRTPRARPHLAASGLWAAATLAFAAAASPAAAQAPPAPAEIAAYAGLHAAAARGDAAEIARLAAAGADPDARDGRGRTPLHVAAFFARRDAMRALVAAGADPRALEADRYDTATIAAVRDDVETVASPWRSAPIRGRSPAATTARR